MTILRYITVTAILEAAVLVATTNANQPTPLLEQPLNRPDDLQDYYDLRDKCDWKVVSDYSSPTSRHDTGTNDFNDACADQQLMSCEIEATFPEGKGLYKIVRIGPFTTHGGIEEFKCQYYMNPEFTHPKNKVDWMTRHVSGPVDPYTGVLLGFPPIHIHHSTTGPFEAYEPEEMLQEAKENSYLAIVTAWGGVSATSQCQESMGGAGCQSRALPVGYGFKRFKDLKPEKLHVAFHLQDVRAPDSPPMMSSMEYGIFHLTEPKQEMKSVQDFRVFIGNTRDHLYRTSLDAPVYQFATYYLPSRVEFMSCIFHEHDMMHDEAWVVRGTQEDLGIPEEVRRPTIYRKNQPGANQEMMNPVVIDPATDSLEAVKIRMEDALNYAAEERKKEREKFPQDKSAAGGGGRNAKIKSYNPHSPPKSYAVPEILCKYYGTVEKVDDEGVLRHEQRFIDAYDKYGWVPKSRRYLRGSSGVEATQYDNTTASVDSEAAGFELAGDGEDEQQEQRRLAKHASGFDYDSWPLSAEEQLKAIDGTTMRGSYYRNPDSAQDRHEKRNSQCNAMSFEAGEYFTVMHFSEKRAKAPAGEFPFEKFVVIQHTIFGMAAYLPDLNSDLTF